MPPYKMGEDGIVVDLGKPTVDDAAAALQNAADVWARNVITDPATFDRFRTTDGWADHVDQVLPIPDEPAIEYVTPPQPVYTNDSDAHTAQTAVMAAQWRPSHYATEDERPLWFFAGDTPGATVACGDGAGGIWHAYSGPCIVGPG